MDPVNRWRAEVSVQFASPYSPSLQPWGSIYFPICGLREVSSPNPPRPFIKLQCGWVRTLLVPPGHFHADQNLQLKWIVLWVQNLGRERWGKYPRFKKPFLEFWKQDHIISCPGVSQHHRPSWTAKGPTIFPVEIAQVWSAGKES